MQHPHVSSPSTAVLLASQTDSHTDILTASWLSILNDDSDNSILSSLDTLTAPWSSDYTYSQLTNMASVQDQISSQTSEFSNGEQDHSIVQTSQGVSSQPSAVVYNFSQTINASTPAEQIPSVMAYIPVKNEHSFDSQKASENPPANEFGQSYTFNVADYANFRYQMSQTHPGESVVTQQPQSSSHQLHSVPHPARVPQPSHLISPLLAQSRPQLPSGLRNSNYLIHPIIARPSTQLQQAAQEPKEETTEKTTTDDTLIPQATSSVPSSDNSVSSSHTDNSLQMQLNELVQNTIPASYHYQVSDVQVKSEKEIAENNQTVPDSQTAPPIVHSTKFLLHGGHTAPTHSVPYIPQPVSSQSSQSSSSDSSDDDSNKLAIADITSSETSSDDSGLQASEPHHDFSQNPPVNFWEQHVASARIAASGVAHPKPVRLSSNFQSMFPPTTFPWANSGMYQQPFHPTLATGTAKPESRYHDIPTFVHTLQHNPESSTEQQPPPSSGQKVKEEPQQAPFSQSDSFSYFLNEFPKSLDNLSSLQPHPPTSRTVVHHAPDAALVNQPTTGNPACPTPEKKEHTSHGANMFSLNTFMSPSYFTQQHLARSGMNPEMLHVSSTPEANPCPVSNDKVSDDDSAIDINSGSSSTSPTSSINSRGSPELIALHLQNEDSNSSVSDTSLLRSRSSSVSSICDSSISSTASSSSNSSFSAPRNKRPNPDPDMGNYKKKSRTSYTPGQLRALERVYMENPYPECDTIDRLARELDIPEQRLRVWFQNKRARMRRQAKQNKQVAPHAPVNPYNAQPLSAIMSSAAPYSFLPPNSMMAPGQPSQMMQRPYFPYPQGAPGSMMQHPGNAPGIAHHPSPLMTQQPHGIPPQQSQIQRLYSFIAHKQ